MSTNKSPAFHFLVRVPLVTRVQNRKFNTLDAHNELVSSQGWAHFAKFGANVSAARIDKLTGQIKARKKTLLIAVTKTGNEFVGYSAETLAIGSAPQVKNAPGYYSDVGKRVSLWFTIGTPFEVFDLATLLLESSRRPVLEVLKQCRTSSMLVVEAMGVKNHSA